eukprot:jgi/Tetstr1/463424/TSEL_000728.t1
MAPQVEDTFGYAFADILNNCAERKQCNEAGTKKHMLEAGSDMGTGVKNASVDGPSQNFTSRELESPHPESSTAWWECWRSSRRGRAASSSKQHNTNAVKNLAATQAVPGDNVDEGSSPQPPAKKAKHAAKHAAGVPARGRGGAGARAGGGAFGSRGGRHAAVAAASTREQQAGRRSGPAGRKRM